MKQKRKEKILLADLTGNKEFIDFLCYKEDKWLQNSSFEEKIRTFFGNLENATEEFQKDEIFNSHS